MEISPNMGFGKSPMLRLLYKSSDRWTRVPPASTGQEEPPREFESQDDSSIRRTAVGPPVKALLLEMADAVQHAVEAMEGDPAEIVGRGADGAPSARIDRTAEQAVLRVLEYEGASLNVLSEEAGYLDRGGKATLVLDPIDGTHNALRGFPAYSVSMAIGHERLSDVQEAMVRDLVSGATYYAAKGGGAWLNARPIHVHPRNPADLMFTVYLGSHAAPEAAKVTGRARRVRSLGAASLDLCLVARGAADLYYMHSSMPEAKLRAVDIAGATLIVREAGGLVLDLEGRDLDIPLTSTSRTDLVAVGDRQTWEAIR
jgi:fructose-1,6-bisphosphatase/inositol monophosphatase family enzyme